MQLIQNATARLLTHTKKRDHITPILAALRWLPVSFRIDLKILLIAFKVLKGQAPVYICDLLIPYQPDRCLRSSSGALLMAPKSRLVTKGFAIRVPKLWNSLPGDIRHATTVSSFKSLLKTIFYRMAFSSF